MNNSKTLESQILDIILPDKSDKNLYEKEYELYFLLGFHYPEVFASLEYESKDADDIKKTLNPNYYNGYNTQKNHLYTEINQNIKEFLRRSINFIGTYQINQKKYNKLHLETVKRKGPTSSTIDNEKIGFNNNKSYSNELDSNNSSIIRIKLNVTKNNKLVIAEFKKNFTISIPNFLEDCQFFAKIKRFTEILLLQNNNKTDNIISLKPQYNYTLKIKNNVLQFLSSSEKTGGFIKYRKNTKFNKKSKITKKSKKKKY